MYGESEEQGREDSIENSEIIEKENEKEINQYHDYLERVMIMASV